MVRVINQQTFDDVVKENMEEFEMDVEEAIEEAIKQFEAQGVNLSGIVKTKEMAEGKDPLVICITQLQGLLLLKSSSPVSFTNYLNQLKEECLKDLARKILAAKQGAYPLLIDILDKFSNDDPTVILCLQALTALMDGFPDLLDSRGAMTITTLLSSSKNNQVIINDLKWARVCCINHELNRQLIVDSDIVPVIKSLLEKNDPSFIQDVSGLIRSLTLDDDVRAEISKAHNHASALAKELLCPITNLLTQYKKNKIMVAELLMTMNCLVVRNEFCAKVEEAGGIPFAIDVLTEYPDDERIVRNSLMLLKHLSGNDEVKAKVVQSGAPGLVLMALSRHQKSPAVCNAGLSVITIVSLRSKENSQLFVDQGAPEIILQIMNMHPKNVKIQRNCCWAIRNIVARSLEFTQEFLKLGVEELINTAISNHKEINYDAKSALRDLGCKVDFIEQWTGKGVQTACE